jgi:hypothetical protein
MGTVPRNNIDRITVAPGYPRFGFHQRPLTQPVQRLKKRMDLCGYYYRQRAASRVP